jgi:uncharacterized phiE125 gp8 family phage protein
MPPYPARTLTRTALPSFEPLTLAETKLYLRVDHADDDAAILRMIQSAREAAEEYLRRSFITQEWQLDLECGLEEPAWLPRGPVQSILSVQRISETGAVLETLNPSLYHLNGPKSHLVAHVALADAVRVTYRTGYGMMESVPACLRQGLLAHVAALYEGPAQEGLPTPCLALYVPYRERSL